jgi:outer membrane protein
MRKWIFLVIIFSFFTELAFSSVSLKQAFEAARVNMESIKRADAFVQQNEELKSRAEATIRPTISGVASYTKIDPPSAAGRSPFLLTRQYSYGFRLSQPIVRGGSIAALELAKENIILARYQKDVSEINLYQLVINSYYNLALAKSDLNNVLELKNFSQERVKVISDRSSIGRSRRGELVEAQAQLHIADSQYQEALTKLQEAQRMFEFHTALNSNEVNLEGPPTRLTLSLEAYLQKLKSRPDILASNQQTKVATKQVEIAKGSHYPQVDLTSNYYIERTGVLATSEWDVGVAVIIPLYQGGGVQAAVRQAVEEKRISELRKDETIRAAERDVMINYQNLIQIEEQLKSLKEALNKSEEAYRLNKKDYQFGLVTNLDVLQSMNMYIQTKRSVDTLIAMGHMNQKNLEALTGVLP